MKKRLSALLSLAMACALVLSLAVLPTALAAEGEIPVPDSTMGLVSDAASTGTSSYTTSDGKTHTVYLYPAGTTISGSWLYSVESYEGDSYTTVQFGGSFVLPESGIFTVTTMDAMTYTQSIFVSADGSSSTTEPEPTTDPADQPSSWAAEQVNAAIDAGIVPEALQSQYTQTATRAEFCALATALYETATGKEITERATFSDTSDVNVEKMAGLGVVGGVGDGKFNPDGQLNREQAATILARLAEALGKPLPASEPTFADNGSISAWAKAAVGQMQASGVMSGTGSNSFSPLQPYTREQCMMTTLRLFEQLG
ncbi:MAG TPA: S-layer homology domain-containing protein [Candidatus Flavonifractor merdavium]|nr:S-layer homology domain-containing protein [Candidatus Flavonifractor merdavium]